MNLAQVRKRIDRFARLGPGHLALALQAALPVALTPDLLYRLWANFQRDTTAARALLNMPWIAVADLLLSNLCEETGYEQYEMLAEVRTELLTQLAADPRLGMVRVWELADFIQQYVRRQLETQVANPQLDLARVEQINALAYTDPDSALNELLGAYQRIGAQGGAELLRMASLVEKISAPAQAAAAGQNPAAVAGFEQLKSFSGGLSLWVAGDVEAARDRLERAFGPNFLVQIGSVRLDVPLELVSDPAARDSAQHAHTPAVPPDEISTGESAVQDLLDQVQKLDAGQLSKSHAPAARTLTDFTATRLTWASQFSALQRVDPAQFALPNEDLPQDAAFFVGVFSLNVSPVGGSQIGKISIYLEVKPAQSDEGAVVTSLFPTAEWENAVLSGASLEVGIAPNFTFALQPGAAGKDESTAFPPFEGTLTPVGAIPPYGLYNGKIMAGPAGARTVNWQFDQLQLGQEANLSLGVVLRVSNAVQQLTAAVQVLAEPDFSWLTISLKRVFGSLTQSAQDLVTGRQPGLRISHAETWDLLLPPEPNIEPEQVRPFDSPLPDETAIDTLLRRLQAAAKTGSPSALAALVSIQHFKDDLQVEIDRPVPGEYGFLNLSPEVFAQAGLALPETLSKEYILGRTLYSLVVYLHIQAHPVTPVGWLRLDLVLDNENDRPTIYSLYPQVKQELSSGGTWQKAGVDPLLPYRLLLSDDPPDDRLVMAAAFADNVGAGSLIDLAPYRLAGDQATLIHTEGEASSKSAWEIQQPARAESLYTFAVLFTAPTNVQTLNLSAHVAVRPSETFPQEPGQAAQVKRLAADLDRPLYLEKSFRWRITPPAAPAPRPTSPDDLAIQAAVEGLALRAQPWGSAVVIDRLPSGSTMYIIEPLSNAQLKLKTEHGWLLVRTIPEPGARTRPEMTGFVDASLVRRVLPSSTKKGSQTARPSSTSEVLRGYITNDGAALRVSPSNAGALTSQLQIGTTILLLDPPLDARANIGLHNTYLHVRVESTSLPGLEGYVSAEFVSLDPPSAQASQAQPTGAKTDRPVAYVSAADAILHASHTAASPIVERLPRGAVLDLLDSPDVISSRIGSQGQWLHVRVEASSSSRKTSREGYIAGIYVSLTPPSSPVTAPPSARPVTGRPRPTPVHSRVLLVIYNPRLPSQARQAQTLLEDRGYPNPADLANQLADALRETSHGCALFDIVDTVTRDELPMFEGGFRYTIPNYLQVLDGKEPPRQPAAADYAGILTSLRAVDRINQRDLDEIWLMAPPHSGLYESRMLGPKAFAVNGPGLPGFPGLKSAAVVMGFNYERGLGEMLEAFGHRAEAILKHVFDANRTQARLWERFTQVKKTVSGYARPEVGTMHLAPNSRADYDWSNPELVSSGCDAWLDFPGLSAAARQINCGEWGSDMIGHHRWWFEHLPCAPGRSDSFRNNWWEYILDPTQQHLGSPDEKPVYE